MDLVGSVADAPAAAAPAAGGKGACEIMVRTSRPHRAAETTKLKNEEYAMTPEELVAQLKTALNDRLISAVLYGSAAAGDYVVGTSNYNVLLVLDRLSMAELNAISKPALQWAKAGNRPPLLFTRDQLQASASVFPIELLDMRQSHRVLFGEDPSPTSRSNTSTCGCNSNGNSRGIC